MRKKIVIDMRRLRQQAGVTLVELMISLAIGLVIALAVTMAYVAVRGTATATDAVSRINEDGKLALDMIAREIQMAGTYPAAFTDPPPMNNIRGTYSNVKSPGAIPYNQGIFGCSGAKFNPASGACDSTLTTVTGSDSIVLNYFSSASVWDVGTTNISVIRDCINGRLGEYDGGSFKGDPVNKARVDATPQQPLFVSNRFAINATSYSQASTGSAGNDWAKTISTGSFACNGNGTSSESINYQPIYEGVTQMVIRYAVSDDSKPDDPKQRFYTATEVNGILPTTEGKTGWQRVSAVRVCLLMQSLTGGRNEKANESTSGKEKKYLDCQGLLVTQPVTDRNIYKAFTRVIAARNNLTGVQ